MVEKWVERKVTEKVIARGKNPPTPNKRTLLEEFDLQDTLFLRTTKTEYSVFLGPQCHTRVPSGSAPSSPRPKPVRTRVIEPRVADHIGHSNSKNEVFDKNRSRAQKIYSNLKNLKQPISPGARLSSFISSMFVKDGKRTKNKKECKSEQVSTRSSSASSFSKSCLSRANSPTFSVSSSNKKKFPDGIKRTVRFCPSVGGILDEDHDHRGMRKFTGLARESEKVQKQRQLEEVALDLLNGYWDAKLSKSHDQSVNHDYNVNHGVNYGQEDDNDDGLSCSSSDLFELDNLSFNRDELPVYESTRFDPKIL